MQTAMAGHPSKSNHEIKAILFDYGEVLCHAPTPEQNTRLADFFGISVERLHPLWERNRGPYDRGDLTPEVYWSMLAEDADMEIAAPQIEQVCQLDTAMWSNINLGMVSWARQLRASGLKIGLLSNMHPDMVSHCRKHFPWLEDFDSLTFSGEVRLIKPDPAIYELALRSLGTTAPETLFLDDREVNVRAAQKLGIRAIQFKSVAQLSTALDGVGFPILPGIST